MHLIARDTYNISSREGDDRRSHPAQCPLCTAPAAVKNVTICPTQACTTPTRSPATPPSANAVRRLPARLAPKDNNPSLYVMSTPGAKGSSRVHAGSIQAAPLEAGGWRSRDALPAPRARPTLPLHLRVHLLRCCPPCPCLSLQCAQFAPLPRFPHAGKCLPRPRRVSTALPLLAFHRPWPPLHKVLAIEREVHAHVVVEVEQFEPRAALGELALATAGPAGDGAQQTRRREGTTMVLKSRERRRSFTRRNLSWISSSLSG